jgi:hypothetical protein
MISDAEMTSAEHHRIYDAPHRQVMLDLFRLSHEEDLNDDKVVRAPRSDDDDDADFTEAKNESVCNDSPDERCLAAAAASAACMVVRRKY